MRRTLLAVVLALATPLPASAAPSTVSFADAPGDWAVPSQDIRRTEVWTGLQGKVRTVRVTLRLTAAPDPTATYVTNLLTDTCGVAWGLRVSGIGTAAQSAALERAACTTAGGLTPESAPATVTVSGTSIVVTAPYALGMAKGTRMTGVGSLAATRWTGVYAGVVGAITTGDDAWRRVAYRLA